MNQKTNLIGKKSPIMSIRQIFCFGFITAPLAMGGLALVMYVPTFYATEIGLGFSVVGAIFVAGRILDVVTDPIIGHFSDETRSRFGPRKPWIVLGVPGFCLFAWLLLVPPENTSALYLAIVAGLYFLFYTILDVPYSSIGLEISPDTHERSLLASSKAAFQVVGAISAASIAFVLTLPIPDALVVIAQAIAVLGAIGLVLFLLFVPDHQRTVTGKRTGIVLALKTISTNPPYRYLTLGFLIVQTANSLTAGLTVLFITHVIGTPHLIGLFMGLLFLSTALFLPVWIVLSRRIGKKHTWAVSIVLCSLALAAATLLGQGEIYGVAVVCILIGAAFGCDAVMPTSMLADIVYEGERDGRNRLAGLFLAIKNSASKMTFVVPMGLAFPALDLIGFDKTGNNSPGQLAILVLFFAGVPIALRLLALVVLKGAPLGETTLPARGENDGLA
ncbi:MFS transporter [uncultured Hoeflea sp.]|uniref:MFS transporter n=1 Tax=uncultured Hoeflea sp. TaxID=538666 RepID=UPI0030D74CFD